jgi:predicted small lipoprotein YifL
MKFRTGIFAIALVVFTLLSLAACGGSAPAKLSDIAVYPDATALKPGENPMADTLAQNVQQAANMGANIDQKIFALPKEASWDQVKKFYSDKLTADSWTASNLPIPDNDMFKMSLWTRGSQSLTVAQITEPINKDSFLLFSLSTQ